MYSKEIGLNINETKTEYMILPRKKHRTGHLKVNNY